MSLHTCYLCYFIAHPYIGAKRPPNEAEEFKNIQSGACRPSQTSPELGSIIRRSTNRRYVSIDTICMNTYIICTIDSLYEHYIKLLCCY